MMLRKSLLASAVLAATLGLTGCGGSSDKKDPVTPPVTPTNQAPTAIALTVSSDFSEDMLGAVVGQLSATDDSTSGLVFTTNDVRFTITDGVLSLKENLALNFEDAATVDVELTVTDAGGLTFTDTLTVNVVDLDAQNGVNVYEFASTFTDGSSVSYTGQIARHALSAEIKEYMSTVSSDVASNTPEQVSAQLNALWGDYAAISESNMTFLGDLTNFEQKTFADISGSGKELSGKVAGNDGSKMYKDWLAAGSFVGWTDFGTQAATPEGLIKHLLDLFVAQVAKVNSGEANKVVGTDVVIPVHITPEGLDLVQLVQKHTLGAVMFSQGTDDYLEEGLNSDNVQDGTKAYTKLAHQFDEGFGYFGASRNYLEYSDKEIAIKGGRDEFQGKNDINSNGTIDLGAEFVWGNSSNAAKRDLGATNPIDLTAEAMTHFIAGRKILADVVGTPLSDEQMTQLKAHAKAASLGWEKAIAATVIHYINDSIADLAVIKTGEFTADQFATYAKHWGEMKGFALNLQFSPYSPFAHSATVANADFVSLHTLFKDAPVLDASAVEVYQSDLIQARDILQAAYNFDADTVADW